MSAVISQKWQVTIPLAVRSMLKWETGDTLDFIFIKPNRVELVVKKTPVSALKRIIAKPRRPLTLTEMDAAIGHGG